MAQIVITIQDIEDEVGVDISVVLIPPVEKDNLENQTPAQNIAAQIIELLTVLGAEK